ncbi:MFS transporter, partial [Bacillus cereus]
MLKPFLLRVGNFQFFSELESSGGEVGTEITSPRVESGDVIPPPDTGEVATPPEQMEQSPIENNPEGQPPEG